MPEGGSHRLPGEPVRERELYKQSNGDLYDSHECRCVGLEELGQEVRAGCLFRAYDQATGDDCTFDVLRSVLARAVKDPVAVLLGTLAATGFQTGPAGLTPRPPAPARPLPVPGTASADRHV
ncbi:polyhydroxyalkanoate synthesis regulator DNA-binding domain-containing protein [Streptomyces enissocaesilis]|uniref:polyhydroxyalkanoate synthesis regulator DNA-binding domain-containing protein n=1 Tax=Streptomyces enissocaesilis TaxID=332589 RepID=UPI003CD070EF